MCHIAIITPLYTTNGLHTFTFSYHTKYTFSLTHKVIQLHSLVRRSTIFILSGVLTNPKMDIPRESLLIKHRSVSSLTCDTLVIPERSASVHTGITTFPHTKGHPRTMIEVAC